MCVLGRIDVPATKQATTCRGKFAAVHDRIIALVVKQLEYELGCMCNPWGRSLRRLIETAAQVLRIDSLKCTLWPSRPACYPAL